MTTTKKTMIALAMAGALLGATSALASDAAQDRLGCSSGRLGGAMSHSFDYSALYGDPAWPSDAPRAPAITLQGAGQTESFLAQDPTWPETAVVAAANPLDADIALRPDPGTIDNEGPWQPARAHAHLDATAACDCVALR